MERASFTVHTKSGIAYDANQLTAHFQDGDMLPMVSFICSGRMKTMAAHEIKRISFYERGVGYCNACDEPLNPAVVQVFPDKEEAGKSPGDSA